MVDTGDGHESNGASTPGQVTAPFKSPRSTALRRVITQRTNAVLRLLSATTDLVASMEENQNNRDRLLEERLRVVDTGRAHALILLHPLERSLQIILDKIDEWDTMIAGITDEALQTLERTIEIHRKLFPLKADNKEEKKKKKKKKKQEGKNTKGGKKRENAEKTKQLVDFVIKKKKKPNVDPLHLRPFIRRSILNRPSPSLPSSNDEKWPGNRPIKRNPKREIEPADITITLHQNAKTETPRQPKGFETLSVEEVHALRMVLTESALIKEEMRDLQQTVADLRQEIKEMKEKREKMVLPARAIAAARKDVKKMCAYCTKRSHFGIECKTYTSSEQRIKVLTRYGRCLGCFRKSCKNLACGTRCNECGLEGFNQAHCPGEH